MKKLNNFLFQKTGLMSLVLLMMVVILISFVRGTDQETYYKSFDRSHVSIQGTSTIGNWSMSSTALACDGHFVQENGLLQEISELNFVLPVSQLQSENPLMGEVIDELFKYNEVAEIRFKQNNAMVLSVMKMTNVVGELQIGNKSQIVELQLSHTVNADKSLTFRGTKVLKLSDYQLKMPESILGAIKNGNEVKVELEITLSNQEVVLIKSKELSE